MTGGVFPIIHNHYLIQGVYQLVMRRQADFSHKVFTLPFKQLLNLLISGYAQFLGGANNKTISN